MAMVGGRFANRSWWSSQWFKSINLRYWFECSANIVDSVMKACVLDVNNSQMLKKSKKPGHFFPFHCLFSTYDWLFTLGWMPLCV